MDPVNPENQNPNAAGGQKKTETWWGEFTFKTEAAMGWEIGPLRLLVKRFPGEWFIAYEQSDQLEEADGWRFEPVAQDPRESGFSNLARFVGEKMDDKILVQPALADRPMVVRPVTPLTVPPGEAIAVYVSTPLWVVLNASPSGQTLLDLPTRRPSDTWFGPSTTEGEACYAGRTNSRVNLNNISFLPYRATTQINIRNQAKSPLRIARLKLPVPYLSLFSDVNNALWTESITVVNTSTSAMAEFDIERGPPNTANGAILIASPRHDAEKGMLIRMFSALTGF